MPTQPILGLGDSFNPCRQTGPVVIEQTLPEQETAFSADTSLLFKETRVIRLFDKQRNNLSFSDR